MVRDRATRLRSSDVPEKGIVPKSMDKCSMGMELTEDYPDLRDSSR
jgi:hypothetical protein